MYPSYWLDWLPYYQRSSVLSDHMSSGSMDSIQVTQTADQNGMETDDIENKVTENSTLLKTDNVRCRVWL